MPKSITTRPVRAEQHVGGLEVAVHDARPVDRGQRGRRADGQPVQRAARRAARPARPAASQRGPGDVLADDVRPVAGESASRTWRGAERRDPLARPPPRAGTGRGRSASAASRACSSLIATCSPAGGLAEVDGPLAALPEKGQDPVLADAVRFLKSQRARNRHRSTPYESDDRPISGSRLTGAAAPVRLIADFSRVELGALP